MGAAPASFTSKGEIVFNNNLVVVEVVDDIPKAQIVNGGIPTQPAVDNACLQS